MKKFVIVIAGLFMTSSGSSNLGLARGLRNMNVLIWLGAVVIGYWFFYTGLAASGNLSRKTCYETYCRLGTSTLARMLLIAAVLCTPQIALSAGFRKSSLGPSAPDLIEVEGELIHGDEAKFIEAAIKSADAIVVFHSGGGNLLAGIEIGKAIRLKGFSTLVPDNMHCASACALAWLAGRVRLMSDTARVGFHAVYTSEDGKTRVSSAGNAIAGAYLNQLGLPTSAIIYITGAPPEGMQWLNFADAQRVGIEVKRVNLNTVAAPPAVQSPAPAISNPKEEVLNAVMNKFYGDFSQKNSCWLTKREIETYCMKPYKVDTRQSGEARTLFVVAAGQKLDEEGQPQEYHAASGVLGLIVLQENGGHLDIVATNSLYEDFGSFGNVPPLSSFTVRELGPGSYGWVIQDNHVDAGEEFDTNNLYAVLGDTIASIGKIPLRDYETGANGCGRRCSDYKVELLLDTTVRNSRFYPLILRASGSKHGREFNKTFRVTFDQSSFKYVLPREIEY